MKTMSAVLALIAFLFAGVALANSAIATSVTGTVQVQSGAAAARALRLGDEVRQGDTLLTGAASSVVLKFEDGQVAALAANSRMVINTYQYNANTGTGNVLLSLVSGGMRAITGLIGRANPGRVAYRAGTATIGIRGTDVTIATALGNVVVTVTEGLISFTFAGRTLTVPAGQGVNARADGTFQQGAAQQILRDVPREIAEAIGGLQGLTEAIQRAAAKQDPPGPPPGQTPSPINPPASSGGGSASGR